MHRIIYLWLLIILLTGGSGLSTAQQNGPETHFSAFASNFPHGIVAHLEVNSPQAISSATFFATMDGLVIFDYEAEIPPHNPGESIQLEGRWDGRITNGEPAPPWGILQMWWHITDATGSAFTTTPIRKAYSDSNRMWRVSPGTFIDAYTYSLDENYGKRVTRLGDEGMMKLKNAYGYSVLYRPIFVFYNSRQDGSDDLGYGDWEPFGHSVGGRAYPGTNIMIALSSSNERTVQRIVLHELAHMHQFQMGSLLIGAPLWWVEGDASAQEPAAERVATLDRIQEIAEQQPLPHLPIWNPTPTTGTDLRWVTDVGASFVIFLEQVYGFESHATFYRNWRSIQDFQLAFEQTYGDSLADLDQLWRTWVATALF